MACLFVFISKLLEFVKSWLVFEKKKHISILAGNLNSDLSYLITAVRIVIIINKYKNSPTGVSRISFVKAIKVE